MHTHKQPQQNEEQGAAPRPQNAVQRQTEGTHQSPQGKQAVHQAKHQPIQRKQGYQAHQAKHQPVQRKTPPNDLKTQMGSQYGVDLSGFQEHQNSSFPGSVNALATIQGKDIHYAPGQYTTQNRKHELGHAIDNTLNGTPKGDKVVNGQSVDTTREKAADKIAETPLQRVTGTGELKSIKAISKNTVQRTNWFRDSDSDSDDGSSSSSSSSSSRSTSSSTRPQSNQQESDGIKLGIVHAHEDEEKGFVNAAIQAGCQRIVLVLGKQTNIEIDGTYQVQGSDRINKVLIIAHGNGGVQSSYDTESIYSSTSGTPANELDTQMESIMGCLDVYKRQITSSVELRVQICGANAQKQGDSLNDAELLKRSLMGDEIQDVKLSAPQSWSILLGKDMYFDFTHYDNRLVGEPGFRAISRWSQSNDSADQSQKKALKEIFGSVPLKKDLPEQRLELRERRQLWLWKKQQERENGQTSSNNPTELESDLLTQDFDF
ncbi:hypothetical protein [uncultured Microscilla sp.]|uniref:hypothetical protein n=1 Tax=uncultured Microscilla sp. TaxID=432653 RepID=UPI00260AFC8B|nr:hypothetical protein [uncultured Microscilla sp.]